MYDEIIATITCPCCNNTYLDEGIQTKYFERSLSRIYQGDDTRTLSKGRNLTENAFYNIRNIEFPCYTRCAVCKVWLEMTGKIRNYIFDKVVLETFKTPVQHGDTVMHLGLTSQSNYAVENDLLKK